MRVQSKLKTLTDEQIQEVHGKTLILLEKTGIRVDSDRARDILLKSPGASLDNGHIRLSSDLVEQAIASAPSALDIYDRHGESAFRLDSQQDSETIFGVGVTNSHYQDPDTNEIVPFGQEHVALAAGLANTLDNFDLLSTPGVIQDPELANAEVLALLEMTANTSKPLVPLISKIPQFEKALDLLSHLHGDLSTKPFTLPYFNPITPLVLNAGTSNKMISTIERGLPLIYSSYGMSGATAPITAASTLVMLNAELLAGLVFTQQVRAGTPVVLGCLPSVFEMKQMISAYTTQTMLVNLACADMMAHYKIPHAGTSGSGPGWGADLMASGGLWMNHLTSVLGKAGLAPFVGGNFDSLVFSPETVIYSNEVIRQVRLLAKGFDLDDASMDLANIESIGPGGNFLMSDQTLNLYLEIHEQHRKIWPNYSLDQWLAKGSPEASELLKIHTLDKLSNLKIPHDHDEIIAEGKAWLAKSS